MTKIDTITLQGKEFVLYKDLLALAHERGVKSIQTKMLVSPLDNDRNVCIMHATVTMKDDTIFEGIGDASPLNVNKMIAKHLIRMAETRAKGRALRDALNIGMVMKEELGGDDVVESETYNKITSNIIKGEEGQDFF